MAVDYKQNQTILDDIQGGRQSGTSLETRALLWSLVAGIGAFAAVYTQFQGSTVGLLDGLWSIGGSASVLATGFGVFGFLLSMYRSRRPGVKRSLYTKLQVGLTSLALAFVHGAIVFLLVAGTFYLVRDAFEGLLLDHIASSVIVAMTAAAASYALYVAAARLSSTRVASALAVFLVAGTLTSMITSTTPEWWQYHFSTLGGGGTLSSYTFNITLIIAGLVVVSLADYVARDYALLRSGNPDYASLRTVTLRSMLALMGVLLACIGLFVYDVYEVLHNLAAGGTVVLFALLLTGLPLLAPGLSWAFYGLSYAIFAAVAGCFYLFQYVGYFNLTTFELLATGIVFGWLVLLIRQIAASLDDKRSDTTAPQKGKTPHMERAGVKQERDSTQLSTTE